MSEAPTSIRNIPTPLRWFSLSVVTLFSGGIAILLSASLWLVGVRVIHWERALPGVHASDIDLSGMTREQIIQSLELGLSYPETGLIALVDKDQLWTARPSELGAHIDLSDMANQALAIGREGNFLQRVESQIGSWLVDRSITPVVVFDHAQGERYLENVAEWINRPKLEASLSLNGTEVEMRPGQIGRDLDIAFNLELITDPISQLHDSNLTLQVEETHPLVLDASAEAHAAQLILSQPLELTIEDAVPWILSQEQLANMMRFEVVGSGEESRFQIILDEEALTAFLEPHVSEVERDSQNARFIFNDDTRELDLLAPAVIGRSLDLPATIEAINQGLLDGDHSIPVVFEVLEPEVGDEATAEDLGVTEEVSVVSSYFHGSSPERIRNIKTASGAFHGILIPPGGSLSMSEVLGDISLDTGYAEALIIYGGRTIKGVGGGVCQVSTTLYRAVFFGGYEIVERHPHAYRVGYYEQGPRSPGPGLDATVFVPLVDFKFNNDSQYWLLLETYIYGNQLLWKFYSTSDGRTVEWSNHVSNEVEAPKPLYRENPDLPEEEIKQVDYEADGMDVVVYRTVSRAGEVLHQDTIKTHYLPWQAIYEYGEGAELPDDAEIE